MLSKEQQQAAASRLWALCKHQIVPAGYFQICPCTGKVLEAIDPGTHEDGTPYEGRGWEIDGVIYTTAAGAEALQVREMVA